MRRPPLVAIVSFLLLALSALTMTAGAQGVQWRDITIAQALAEAAQTNKMILISAHSVHCGQCSEMEADLWNTPQGAHLADGMIPISIDTMGPQGAALQSRYPVTGLPCTIFITPDGKEVDRVVGYPSQAEFLQDAMPLKEGYDPLPGMEETLQAHPDSLPLMNPILERYLNRQRESDAKALLPRVLQLDPENRAGQSERALMLLARYAMFVSSDMQQTMDYWKTLLDRFPISSMAGAAIDGSMKAATALGQMRPWTDWLIGILEKQPQNGRLQYAAAMTAHKAGLHDPRFAKAARTARSLGVGGAFLDSIAVQLEGGPRPAGAPGSPSTPEDRKH